MNKSLKHRNIPRNYPLKQLNTSEVKLATVQLRSVLRNGDRFRHTGVEALPWLLAHYAAAMDLLWR